MNKTVGDDEEEDQAGPNDALLKHNGNTLREQKEIQAKEMDVSI